MGELNWGNYHELSKDYPPRPFLVSALEYVKEKKEALDLGAGALNDAKHLLNEGFEHITVVDVEPGVQEKVSELKDDRLEAHITSFDKFNFPENKYDLVNAQYSLPFHGKEGFDVLIQKIISSLKSEGIFVGQFFGEKDEWAKSESTIAFQTKEEVEGLLSPLETLEFIEEEKDGKTATGDNKHWHVFHFIARKQ